MQARLHRLVRDPLVQDGSVPLLVLLHGIGSDERDLMGLAPELDPRLRVVTLRAPIKWGVGGFAWFNLDWDENGIRIDPAEVQESLHYLRSEIVALKDEWQPSTLVLGGFSQGAVMSLGTSVMSPELIGATMLLSGRHVPQLFAQAGSLEGRPYLVQHGTFDPVLELSGAREMRDALVARGALVEYHEYPMGHEVSMESLADAQAWLERQLTP